MWLVVVVEGPVWYTDCSCNHCSPSEYLPAGLYQVMLSILSGTKN